MLIYIHLTFSHVFSSYHAFCLRYSSFPSLFVLFALFMIIDASSIGQVSTVAGSAQQAGYVDGPALSIARFYYPEGMVVDADGNVLIADCGNDCIRLLNIHTGQFLQILCILCIHVILFVHAMIPLYMH